MQERVMQMIASVNVWLESFLAGPARAERMEQKLDDIIKELADIKALLVQYQQGVTDKITNLESTLAANGGGNAELRAAVDDLKSFATGLQVPA